MKNITRSIVLLLIGNSISVPISAQNQVTDMNAATTVSGLNHFVKLQNGNWIKTNDLGWEKLETKEDETTLISSNINGELSIVFNEASYSNPYSADSRSISVFDNKYLLLAVQKKATKNSDPLTEILLSTDKGDSWNPVLSKASWEFGNVHDIAQLSENEVVIVLSKLQEDQTDAFGRYKSKYYLAYSNDLCKTWTEFDLNLAADNKPSRMKVSGSQLSLFTMAQNNAHVWHSINKGASWSQMEINSLEKEYSNLEDDSWRVFAQTLDADEYKLVENGLYNEVAISDEISAFVGHSRIYTKSGKENWSAFYIPEVLRSASTGIVSMSEGENQYLFYPLAGTSTVLKYSFKNASAKENLEAVADISLFPNPSNGMGTIVIDDAISNEINYSIYALNGQQLQEGNLFLLNGKAELHYEGLSNGVYLMKINVDGQEKQIKLLKE